MDRTKESNEYFGRGGRGGRLGLVKMFYTNAQSVRNKMNLLKAHIIDSRPHLIAITESWTHENLDEVELSLPGYEIVSRCDRKDTVDGRGGGVLLYSSLNNVAVTKTTTKFHEVLAVAVSNKNEPPLHINVVYRSPNSSENNNDHLLDYIKNIPENVVIVGDFNCREIDWETLSVSASESSFSQKLLNVSQDRFLQQHVDFPTNFTPQPNGTITETCIDLIFSDNPDNIASVKSVGHLGKSKHVIIEAELKIPSNQNETTELVPDFSKANFEAMNETLALVDWESVFQGKTAEECWKIFNDKLSEVIESCIPKKKRRFSSRPLWMNQNVMRVIRKKRRLWKWYCQTKDYQDYLSYQKVCSTATKAVRKAKKNLERKLAKNIKSNPKSFYKYLNSCSKSRSKVGPLRDDDGVLQTDDKDMTSLLNNTFGSVFTVQDTENLTTPHQPFEGSNPLSNIVVERENVFKKINLLDPSKSPGPDQNHPKVIKELGGVISFPLSIVFNKSLAEGAVPSDWRIANVASIFKKGDRTEPSNYRPISLTSIICKLLESLIRDAIMNHLIKHNLINSSQHGFWPHRSCLTNLLEYLEEVTKLIDAGHSVDLLYLDFSRAFDKVPHKRLLSKVRSLGVVGNVAAWIEAWLTDRKQRVVLNGRFSDWINVTSGVPQGSVLGPVLFVMYINDIENAVDTIMLIKKFADDTKGCGIADTIHDCEALQQQINKLYDWSVEWQMLFNMDKCKIIHLGANNINYNYTMGGQLLKKDDHEKDLGFHIHKSLTPSMHIAAAVKKANQVLGQILRSVSYRDKVNFLRLYTQRVRCHLEHVVQCWNPWLKKDIDLIENVQKRAVRCIQGLHGSYEDKLKQINLPSLVERRHRGDMIQTFKIVNQIDDVDPHTWFHFANDSQRPLRSNISIHSDGSESQRLALLPQVSNLEVRRSFFSNRVVEPWNKLPDSMRCAKTTNNFKNLYDKHV